MKDKMVLKIANHLEKINNRLALGYEETISFNYGFLYSLMIYRSITRKQYNTLIKVFANSDNGDYRWFINDNGQLEVDPQA